MRRNAFGEAQPADAGEIVAAMAERGLDAEFAQAEIFDATDAEAPFNGWCAEISDADTGDNRISTLGFVSLQSLELALETASICLIVEY